uniref:Family with sequence similarity 183 member A n=1 Tax=Varanus komodoensis TaxID=61221 RepID=A0A8D2KSL3_VARKO
MRTRSEGDSGSFRTRFRRQPLQRMAGAKGASKEPLDPVSQNKIFCETIRKELRCQRLHTEYTVNPLLKVHTLTGKPMSWHDNLEEPADAKFLKIIHHAALEPTKKYTEPQTESQEIGWYSTPLVSEVSGYLWGDKCCGKLLHKY